MTDTPADDDDEATDASTGAGRTTTAAAIAAPINSQYKVLGQIDVDDGVGVLGQNDADTGTSIGVQGAVPNNADGFGLATPHDARIQGTVDTGETDFVVEAGTTATSDATNVVMGHASNEAGPGVVGAVVGGGGYDDGAGGNESNRATGDYATISGGRDNSASNEYTTIGGGERNNASFPHATVGGGKENQAGGQFATVGGGFDNDAFRGSATVAGGLENDAQSRFSTVGGGKRNTATSGEFATVGGGTSNFVTGKNATIGGGRENEAGGTIGQDTNRDHTVAGGRKNRAITEAATIGGGLNNTVDGGYATVPGGRDNRAQADYTFAAGRRAKANSGGAFVWADSVDADFTSDQNDSDGGSSPTGNRTFHVRATGGVRFVTSVDSNDDPDAGAYLSSGGSSWNAFSARSVKHDVRPVDPKEVLSGVESLAVSRWAYDARPGVDRMGPMAGDFYETFGLGDDPETIGHIDADGVALAAIQGLAERLDEAREAIGDRDDRIDDLEAELGRKDDRIDEVEAETGALREENERLRERNEQLESRLEAIETRLEDLPADPAPADHDGAVERVTDRDGTKRATGPGEGA